MSVALITGATSGIGRATAEKLAARGYNLILLARRGERLEQMRVRLSQTVQVTVATVDVREPKQIQAFVTAHTKALSVVTVLINNAGLAKGADKIQDGKLEDWDAMLDTNVKGLLYITRAVLPFLLKNNRGDIVNVGSVAGRWVYPGGGVYCASKFAVRALSEGLRMDLFGTPLRVTNIEPGLVQTEFSQVRFDDSARAEAVYHGLKPLSAGDIADSIVWCVERPAHVNIQELVIFPTAQASVTQVHREKLD